MSLGLEEARTRLAYINQHRELALGVILGLCMFARALGVHISLPILLLLAGWLALSLAFVRFTREVGSEARLQRLELGYFVLELALVTCLVHFTGAAEWVSALFYSVTILYANVVLPPKRAWWITLLAAACFTGLVALEYEHVLAHVALFGHRSIYPNSTSLTVILLTTTATYLLLGYTSGQFSRMLNSKAEALESVNRDLKATGGELRRHQNHLEELVRERTGALENAYEELRRVNSELRRLNELKTNFLANVSHELRTPLTSIRSFSEILLSYPDEDLATRTEFLEIIKSESERLTRLINDVLDLAKIEAGKMEWRLAPHDIGALARRAAEIMSGWAVRKGIALRVDVEADLPPLLLDEDRILQVLTNLLNNALKFTSQGYVAIAARRLGDEVCVQVSDTGPGIPQEDLHRIFDKFHQRGDTLTSKPAGTGLGLTLCRETMQHHGGRIWAESEAGAGSHFFCTFPIPRPAQPASLPASRAAAAGEA